jgi:hypothetical protein
MGGPVPIGVAVAHLWLAIALVCSCAEPARAQGEAPDADAPAGEGARQALAAARLITVETGGEEPAMLDEQPVLKWSNNYATPAYGSIFVWKQSGRPVVIGSIRRYPRSRKSISVEFHSLAEGSLEAFHAKQSVWRPTTGISFRPLEGIAVPATSSQSRLQQMRAIARDFSADVTTFAGVNHRLRLMPQPLCRYEGDGREVADGAMFTFVRETDPDVLLLIEARGGEDRRWEYALARMHTGALRALYHDKEVWSVDQLAQPFSRPMEPFTLLRDLPFEEGK